MNIDFFAFALVATFVILTYGYFAYESAGEKIAENCLMESKFEYKGRVFRCELIKEGEMWANEYLEIGFEELGNE